MPLMGIPSIGELIIIFGVVFLLFGGKKLPELGGAIGESIKNFKKGIKDDHDDTTKRLVETSTTTISTQSVQPPVAQPVAAEPVRTVIDQRDPPKV